MQKRADKFKKDSVERYLAHFLLISLMLMDATIIRFLTRFFPFSLLYKDTLGHAKNMPLKMFVDSMEKYLKEQRMPVLIKSGDLDPPLATLFVVPRGKYRISKHAYLIKLEELLQKEYQTVFVRDYKTGFRILVSTEILNNSFKENEKTN